MKRRIFIFASLLAMFGSAHASECIGDGCDITATTSTPETITVTATTNTISETVVSDAPLNVEFTSNIPMTGAKLLSIKPVPADERAPLWDGTDEKFAPRAYDKTVSEHDGAPLWDDSIVSYRDRDFSDWYLESNPAFFANEMANAEIINQNIRIADLYEQNMADAAATRARVEELLSPRKPTGNLWTTDNVSFINDADTVMILESDGCPFESDVECDVWRRKPMVRETVSPRSAKIRDDKMANFITAAHMNKNITANTDASAPLLARYKMLMRAANSCCTDGLVYSLRDAGASDGLVYKFLADDANFYGLGARCLMMTDAELDTKYPNTATAMVAADVRNGCLCRGREWFTAMLAPFTDVYNQMPEFKNAPFNYTYTDGLQREITVSVNNDVQNVLKQLASCP